jgi:hypothetical protein
VSDEERPVVTVPVSPGTIQEHRAKEANLITAALAVVCGLAFAGALIPAVEHAMSVLVVAAMVPVAAVVLLRWVLRRVRWYREDRDDERVVAALRAGGPLEEIDRRERIHAA